MQGQTRLARAETYVQRFRAAARARGITPDIALTYLHSVGHDVAQAIRHGNLAPRVMQAPATASCPLFIDKTIIMTKPILAALADAKWTFATGRVDHALAVSTDRDGALTGILCCSPMAVAEAEAEAETATGVTGLRKSDLADSAEGKLFALQAFAGMVQAA